MEKSSLTGLPDLTLVLVPPESDESMENWFNFILAALRT